MQSKTKTLILCIAIPLIVGAASTLLIRNSIQVFGQLDKPPLSPPGFLFPIVWTILYFLMGYASYLIVTSNASIRNKNQALSYYALQLTANFVWPVLFFSCGWYLFSFIWIVFLWTLILLTITLFHPINQKAAYLMIPYLLWVTYAAYLNLGIYLLY